jgi:hypothetical protein
LWRHLPEGVAGDQHPTVAVADGEVKVVDKRVTAAARLRLNSRDRPAAVRGAHLIAAREPHGDEEVDHPGRRPPRGAIARRGSEEGRRNGYFPVQQSAGTSFRTSSCSQCPEGHI